MAAVDVRTEIDIARPRAEVAAFAVDPGPFPMETTYTWEDHSDGGTRMTLRNRGEPSGFRKIAAPVMAGAIRRANVKDLSRLKWLLESPGAGL